MSLLVVRPDILIGPPLGEYLIALDRRLLKACNNLSSSPSMGGKFSGKLTDILNSEGIKKIDEAVGSKLST